MRRRLALAFVLGGAGCSLFLDTEGFEGEPPTGGSDASTADTTPSTPPDDATSSPDVVTDPDAAVPDAAPDVMSMLVGDWPFDEGSGNVILDKSGRSHNGLVSGGTWAADHLGAANQALVFDGGASNFVSIAGGPDFTRTATLSFTMLAWARFDDAPGHDMFFSVSFGTQDSSFGIELVNETTLTYWDGNDHIAQAAVPSVVGQWHHFGVVVEGSQARIYFDGVRVSQAVADTTPRMATQVFFGHSTFGDYLRGAVDKARFFRAALTDAEMMTEKNR